MNEIFARIKSNDMIATVFVRTVAGVILFLALVNRGTDGIDVVPLENYLNTTLNRLRNLGTLNEAFEFTPRVGRKPFTKKSNFLSFETKNENIEVGFEFSIPFLTVPVKRSVDNVRATAQSIMTPLANINSGAIFLAGVMVAAGVTTAYIWRIFGQLTANPTDSSASQSKGTHWSRIKKDEIDEKIWPFMDTIEEWLQKYDIDAVACTQRIICGTVKGAADSVINGHGTSSDKIIDGLTSSQWLLNWIAGTAVERAVQMAHSKSVDCYQAYPTCKIKSDNSAQYLDTFLRLLI